MSVCKEHWYECKEDWSKEHECIIFRKGYYYKDAVIYNNGITLESNADAGRFFPWDTFKKHFIE